jgi:disulfide bond formation protein DsbB
MKLERSKVLLGIAGASLAAVGFALVGQHGFDMQPCPWCALQRLIYVTIAIVALAGLAWRSAAAARALPLLLLLLCSFGIAAALWQHFVAAASDSCNLTLADRVLSTLQLDALLPAVFQPRASCADAAVNVLGVPFEFWSVAMFASIEAAALWLFVAGRRIA